MKYKPLKCQAKAYKFVMQNLACGLLVHMGVGKTVVMLSVAKSLLYQYLKARRVLIVAPLRVARLTWPDEIAKWDHTQRLTYTILHGPKKGELIKQAHDTDITLVNYSGLIWMQQNWNKLPSYDLIIADESTFIKNGSSKRTKVLHDTSRWIHRKVILTGSPIPNGMEDLWSQIYLLDRGQRLGATLAEYRRRYFYPNNNPNARDNYYLRTGAKEEILKAISDLVMVVESKDVEGLPSVVDNPVMIELPKRLRKQYTEIEKDFLTTLDSGITIEALNQQAQAQKLRQFISGFSYVKDADGVTTSVVDIHKVRLQALKELRQSLSGHNLFIAIQYKEEVEQIRRYFKRDIPCINSTTTTAQDIETIRQWNAGHIPELLAHPASVAHGLNLQAGGNHIIWYSQTWLADEREQFIARLRRRGQESDRVWNHKLLMPDTMDTVMDGVVTAKVGAQESALKYLKEHGG